MSKYATFEQSVTGRGVTREERALDGIGDCRVYVTEDGDWYPSVTEITDFRPNPRKRRALAGFRRKYDGVGATEHHTDISTVKMHFGTLAHYFVLQPLTDQDLWGESEEIAKRELQNHGQFRGVDAWEWARRRFAFVQRSFYRALDRETVVDVLGVERYVIDAETGYAGQYDLLYTRQGRTGEETVLCDLKTGKNVYPDHELQIAAYANAVDVDIDEVRIVRTRPTGSAGELEVCTETDFQTPREARLDEFVDYARQFHERIATTTSTASTATASTREPDATVELDQSRTPSEPAEARTTRQAESEDDEEELDPIEAFVETHTGSPIGMGRQMRNDVDNGEIPALAERNLENISEIDDEELLERLDELLPEYGTPDDSSDAELTPTNEAESPRSTRTQSGDRSEDSTPSSDSFRENQSSARETTTVDLSPMITMLLDRAASGDRRFADTRATIVDNALDVFLASTVGAALDPAQFAKTSTGELSIDCDPVLGRLLEVTAATDDRFNDTSDVALAAISEGLGLTEQSTSVQIDGFDRYQMIVDTLLETEDCPCETVDDVVEVALEKYLVG